MNGEEIIIAIVIIISALCLFSLFFWEKLYNFYRVSFKIMGIIYIISIFALIAFVIYNENKVEINNLFHFLADKLILVTGLFFVVGGFAGTINLVLRYAPNAKIESMKDKRKKALLAIGACLGACNLFISMMIFEFTPLDKLYGLVDRLSRDSGFADGYSFNLMAALSCWTTIPFFYRILRRYLALRNGAVAVISVDD